MAFAVEDFQDLIRLLGEHPEWRAELRRHVLTDDILEVPGLLRQQAEHLASVAARMDQLTERVDQLTQRMDQLTARMAQLAARVDELTARVDQIAIRLDQLTAQVEQLTARVDHLTVQVEALTQQTRRLADDVGGLKGQALEQAFRTKAPAYLGRIARRLRVVEHTRLADALDDGVDAGKLTEAERDNVLLGDVVLSGRRRGDDTFVYLLVEVSVGLGTSGVRRAAMRAASLAKLGTPVIAVAAGQSSSPVVADLAQASGVRIVLDGHDADAGRRYRRMNFWSRLGVTTSPT